MKFGNCEKLQYLGDDNKCWKNYCKICKQFLVCIFCEKCQCFFIMFNRGGGAEWAGWAFAHPVFREQNRNSLTSNLQSIKMKICRVVPILDTVGHMTNYTWIGPVVIVNLILFLKLFLVQLVMWPSASRIGKTSFSKQS